MDQVHVRVVLTNHREAVMAVLGNSTRVECIAMRRKHSSILVRYAQQ
jgi:hypothetical protein